MEVPYLLAFKRPFMDVLTSALILIFRKGINWNVKKTLMVEKFSFRIGNLPISKTLLPNGPDLFFYHC